MQRSAGISERSQIILIWCSIVMTVVLAITLGVLLRMIPPPAATLTAEQIKEWYLARSTQIKLGATIMGWVSASLLPFWAVIAIEVSRHEKGRPIWATLIAMSGAMMTIFLVLPPLFFGAAAFAPDRAADVTAALHQLGVLALVTTDQFYIFTFIAVTVVCLLPSYADHSPFPRWLGYFTIWFMIMAEAGAIPFNVRTGPFAWNGLLSFWMPFCIFGVWMIIMSVLLIKSLRLRMADAKKVADFSPQVVPA
jgi:hypothetical protein